MNRRTAICILILLILHGVRLFSQIEEPQPTKFLVISIPTYSGSDLGIQEIINGYMKFELQRAGLLTVIESNIPEGLISDVSAGNDSRVGEALVSRGETAAADFVIACIYDRIVNTIQMTFYLYDVSRGQLIATAVRKRKQTLLVEWSIAGVITNFLAEIEDRLVFADEDAIPEEQAEESAQSLSISTESQSETTSDSEQVAQTTESTPQTISPPYLDDISKRFEIIGGMAPFVLVGKTSDYARVGWNTGLSMGYRFIGDQTQVILAVSTGVCSFIAESAATRSRVFLVPLAARINLRTTPSRLGFLIHLAGGPAAFLASQDQGEYRFKLVPYATSGIGIDIPILNRLGLLIDLSFSVYFEGSQPVMGYAPSANVYYRF